MRIYKQEESEEEVTVLLGVKSPEEAGSLQGGKLHERELARFLNPEKESSEHFK